MIQIHKQAGSYFSDKGFDQMTTWNILTKHNITFVNKKNSPKGWALNIDTMATIPSRTIIVDAFILLII